MSNPDGVFSDPELIGAHRDALERFRGAMNLVGPGPVQVHYDDSRLALEGLAPQGHWADLGTGAGFPGIVFAACFPEVQLDLVDSRSKRCWFLEQVLMGAPRPRVRVLRMRHEQLQPGYDGILSRALHAPERMVEVARRLVRPGGSLVLFLQDDAPVPTADDLEVFHVKHYLVDGKHRKCVALRIGRAT